MGNDSMIPITDGPSVGPIYDPRIQAYKFGSPLLSDGTVLDSKTTIQLMMKKQIADNAKLSNVRNQINNIVLLKLQTSENPMSIVSLMKNMQRIISHSF